MSLRRCAQVFAFGTIAGGALDQIHVQSRTTVYENPVFLDQPWYIALIFGTGITAAYLLAQGSATRAYPAGSPTNRQLTRETLIFLALYFASACVHSRLALGAILLWGVFFLRMVPFMRSGRPAMAAAAFAGAAGGTAIEIALSARGSFHYVDSDVFGVPLWLPALYANAAPLALALIRRFPLDRAALPP